MLKEQTIWWCDCESIQVKHSITIWLKNDGWKFDDFSLFLQAAQIKLPVKLFDVDNVSKTGIFSCISADDKNYMIRLIFGDIDEYSAIHITEGIETKQYECGTKTKTDSIPKLTLDSRLLKDGEKVLYSYYGRDYCNRKLTIDENHFLTINIIEPNAASKNGGKMKVLSNLSFIDYYVFSMDIKSISVEKVYNELISLLNMSKEDIMNCQKIYIAHTETVDGFEFILSEVNVTYGDMSSYTVKEGDELFSLYQDMRKLRKTKDKIKDLKGKCFS